MTDRATAYRKWQQLRTMTTARGCTPAEASTAAKLAASLAAKWGFATPATPKTPSVEYQQRYQRAEQRAGRRCGWEYRTCGKPRCRCARGFRHGPYKYEKRRVGATVRSIYRGRATNA